MLKKQQKEDRVLCEIDISDAQNRKNRNLHFAFSPASFCHVTKCDIQFFDDISRMLNLIPGFEKQYGQTS